MGTFLKTRLDFACDSQWHDGHARCSDFRRFFKIMLQLDVVSLVEHNSLELGLEPAHMTSCKQCFANSINSTMTPDHEPAAVLTGCARLAYDPQRCAWNHFMIEIRQLSI